MEHIRLAGTTQLLGCLAWPVKQLAKSVEKRDKRARKSGYSVSAEKATDFAEAQAWLGVCAR
jgi:hypothetical protein